MPYDVETYEEGPSGLQPNSPNQRLPLSRRIWAHISLGWITLLLATGFYTTTVIYSWHPAIFSRFEIIGRSPARALGFLAILVQLGGIFLTGAICHAVGLLANIRLSCENGTPFLEYLVLQAGTAFEGWVEVMWRAPLREWRPRVWSVLRFLSITIVPIIAIVIMSMYFIHRSDRSSILSNIRDLILLYKAIRGLADNEKAMSIPQYHLLQFRSSCRLVDMELANSIPVLQ